MGITFADESIPGIDLIYPDAGLSLKKKMIYLVLC